MLLKCNVSGVKHTKSSPKTNAADEMSAIPAAIKCAQGFIQDFELGGGEGGAQDSSRMIVACEVRACVPTRVHFRRVRVRGLCLVQLCAKCRLISAALSPYHQCRKIKEAASLKVEGPLLYSCLLIVRLPSGSRTLN